jgi:hypothetical protein
MTVTVQKHDDAYRLMVSSHGWTEVAGPRILRAPPHPDIQWSHLTEEAANIDAEKLRTYLNALPTRKPSKASLRKVVA